MLASYKERQISCGLMVHAWQRPPRRGPTWENRSFSSGRLIASAIGVLLLWGGVDSTLDTISFVS